MLSINISQIVTIESEINSNSDCVSLSQGALRIGGIPKEIKEHLKEVLKTDKTDYYQSAWGILPLREKIAKNLSDGINKISYKNVLVTHGCTGAIATLLLTLLEKGDEVILPEPTYPAYKNIVGVARANPIYVSSFSKDKWFFDIEKIKKFKTNKTKMILFSNPCNPTGSIVPKQDLKELVDWCEKNRIYLVVDESYDNYIFDKEFCSITPFVQNSEFVIRTGSYSKTFSMSGWRIGFMVVPQKLASFMCPTQNALLGCPNVIAQHAVLYSLDHPEVFANFHKIMNRNRDYSVLLLKDIFNFISPDAGFYLFLKTDQKDSSDLCKQILKQARVGLIPGIEFGPSCASYIRLCYARKPQVLAEGISRIRKFFNV
jgi:aspartate/methionine/tyrosine aminotransferase